MHDRYIDVLRVAFEQLLTELEDNGPEDAINQLIAEIDAALERPLTPAELAH